MSDASAGSPSDPGEMNAVELGAAYAAGTLSPVDAATAMLERIERFNPNVNAFAHVAAESALTQARAAEERWGKGTPLGPLDGVPGTIKELTPVAGMPLRRGSRTTGTELCDHDAVVVQRLRAAGVVILGTTTSPEFGWKGVTDNLVHGITRNPWNTNRTPGGSSGGAAVAAALNMGVLHQGTDGGGSVRIPAGFTGVFGIKPTFGWIAQVPPSVMTWLSHLGPLTRTVGDAVSMMQVIAGPHAEDWYSVPPTPTPDWATGLDQGIEGLKIAFSPRLGYANVETEVEAALREAVAVLASLGAEIEEEDPGFEIPLEAFNVLWWSGAAKYVQGMNAETLEKLDPGFREFAERGSRLSAAEYLIADSARASLGNHMARFHERYDLLLTPTLPLPAFEAGHTVPPGGPHKDWPDWTPFSYPFNMTQQPACTIPCGLTSDRLPVGLQIVGAKFRDDLVLRAARAYEDTRVWSWPDSPVIG